MLLNDQGGELAYNAAASAHTAPQSTLPVRTKLRPPGARARGVGVSGIAAQECNIWVPPPPRRCARKRARSAITRLHRPDQAASVFVVGGSNIWRRDFFKHKKKNNKKGVYAFLGYY